MRLTEAGEVLVCHADAILARLQAAERDLEAIAGLRGSIRVVAFPSAGASLMPMAVAAFRERHPDVELILEPREPDEALVALKTGEADVAVTLEAGFAPIEDEAIETIHLLDDPMFVALPRDHALAAKARLRLEDLEGEAWIQGTVRATCPDTRIFLRTCTACGFEPRMAFQSDDYAAIQGFIAAGVGVALIPDLALTTPRDDIAIRALVGVAPHRRVLAATLAGSARGPATQAMVAILEEVGRGWQASRHDLQLRAS